MRILILSPYYAPDLGPSAPLFTMLSEELVRRGHQVCVVAAVPHYPTGKVQPQFRGRWMHKSIEHGVNIIRVAVPSLNRANLTMRCLQFLCFQVGAARASFFHRYDIAVITSPALETFFPFTCQAVIRRVPVILAVFDVYPDVGIKLGIFRNKTMLKIITFFECFCLHHSAAIQIISESFRPALAAHGVPPEKIHLVELWVDTTLIKPLPRSNPFSQEHNLEAKFVVLYAGNIGLSQGLENVLEAARLLITQDQVEFVFVGDGTGRKTLQSLAEQYHLPNVLFIPFQPRERLPEVLASANASLVVLRHGIGVASLPSKTLSILASGRPIIASVDGKSETWKLVERTKAGLCVPPDDPGVIAEAILALKSNPMLCEQFGINGRAWAEAHHSPQNAARQFERLMFNSIHSVQS